MLDDLILQGRMLQTDGATCDQGSGCIQGEDREWQFHKMTVVGGLACRFLGVQSGSQEQSS